MKARSSRSVAYVAALVVVTLFILACTEHLVESNPQYVPIPTPSTPESVVAAIEILYNDASRPAEARLEEYRKLLAPRDHDDLPEFVFRTGWYEIPQRPCPPDWGVGLELEAHEGVFEAVEAGDISCMALDIVVEPPTYLEFPPPGKEDWMELFASSVHLIVVLNSGDSYAVEGGQARFLFAPVDDRWYLTEWIDLPAPAPSNGTPPGTCVTLQAAERTSWGILKCGFANSSVPK